ncbi:MAG: PAS domain S-box protein [Nitrospinae bacterium]|nr:PAS domain S-box protein [Nitrospinota bacterium]
MIKTEKNDTRAFRILVVEDDPAFSRIIQKILQGFDLAVETVSSGAGALDLLAGGGAYNLLLLDYYLADMTGKGIVESQAYQNNRVPFIVMTASQDAKIAVEMMKLGAEDYLIKDEGFRDLLPMAVLRAAAQSSLEKRLREAEENLRESEIRFQSIMDNTTAVIYVKDKEGRYTFVNRRFEKLFHVSNKDIVGKTDHDIFPKDKADAFRANDIKVMKTGVSLEFEETVPQDDGMHSYISIKFPLFGPNGAINAVCGISTDITQRKRIEEELRKLSHAVEQCPVSIIITDTMGNIEYANPKFTQVAGYTLEEVMGKNPRFLKSGKTSQEEYKQLWDIITSGGEWRGEFHNRKKNGELFWELACISSIKNANGDITHFIEVKEDITEKKLEEEKERRQREMLRHADKMVSLGTLAAGVAHEIQNPNNYIILNAPFLDRIWADAKPLILAAAKIEDRKKLAGLPIEETIKAFDRLTSGILKGAERIKGIAAGLQNFACKDLSGLEEEVDVKKAILYATDLLESLIKKNTRRFKISIGDLPRIKGNRLKLEQAMVNLIMNALQSLTRPTQKVEVNAARDQDSGRIVIKIMDTGRGMDLETLRRITEPFFTTRQASGGTGLGAPIAYGIIKDHGGDFKVESKPGKGTTVTVALPV